MEDIWARRFSQVGVGVGHNGRIECTTICGLSEGIRGRRALQCVRRRQHGMGACDNGRLTRVHRCLRRCRCHRSGAWGIAVRRSPPTRRGRLGRRSPQVHHCLLAAVSRVSKRCVGHFNAKALANASWAVTTTDEPNGPLFAASAKASELRVGYFGAHDLSNMAWAFATVGDSSAPLFATLAMASEQGVLRIFR